MQRKVTSKRAQKLTEALASSKDWQRLEQLIEDGKHEAAINLAQDLDKQCKAISRDLLGISVKIQQRHWSPLLEGV